MSTSDETSRGRANSVAAPAVSAASPLPNAPPARRPLLEAIRIRHGNPQLLGRFLLKAESMARERDVVLSFATFQEFCALNAEHKATWGALPAMFDLANGPIDQGMTFCIIGWNNAGEPVAAQAARVYDFGNGTLRDAIEGGAFFYPQSPPPDARVERYVVECPSATKLTGRVTYSGGVWYRPDYRGQQLSSIVPRIGRAYALATWGSAFSIGFVSHELVRRGMAASYGFRRIEPGFRRYKADVLDYDGNLVWMDRDEFENDLFEYLTDGAAKIDLRSNKRSTQK